MRKPIDQAEREEREKNTTIEVTKGGPIPDVVLDGSEGTPTIKGSALGKKDMGKDDQVPPAKWYRVKKGGYVNQNGFRSHLHEGKEINTTNYDIRALQRQGIRLEPCEPGQDPLEC